MPRENKARLLAIATLCLSFGVSNFETKGINYLGPSIAQTMHLTNTKLGTLLSVGWIPYAIGAYLAGPLAERIGTRAAFIRIMLLFALASISSGLATGYTMLLLTRLVMGVLEGPMLPLSQSIITQQVPPRRRGMYMGIVQNVGASILAMFLGPILLVALAGRFGWRAGFFVALVPGLLCALLARRYIPDSRAGAGGAARAAPEPTRLRDLLPYRNVWLCTLSCAFIAAFDNSLLGFLPLFLIRVRHIAASEMSVLMGMLGISMLILGVTLPTLSDRVGRRKVMAAATAIAALACLGIFLTDWSWPPLAALIFLSWAPMGVSVLYFATVPSESVPMRLTARAISLNYSMGTVVGGVAGPFFSGWAADRWGLGAPLLFEAACCAMLAILATLLQRPPPLLEPTIGAGP